MKLTAYLALIAVVGFANHAAAGMQTISSEEQRAVLIELYTSEGCSSCPPAERWLSGLKSDARLWKRIVPVAFHVDYWNYLGWDDRFADARFSKRQSGYQRHGYLHTVYTPGVMKNGREWRGWPSHANPTSGTKENAGVLKAQLSGDTAVVEFTPNRPYSSPLVLNIAVLGFNIATQVAAGESAGKALRHVFVVLGFQQVTILPHDGRVRWMPSGLFNGAQQAAGIALWVTTANDPTPLQATGAWLK